MSSQKVQEKADKRAAALRNNLQKRKAFIKETKQEKVQEDKKYHLSSTTEENKPF